jgi:hypothetical protein
MDWDRVKPPLKETEAASLSWVTRAMKGQPRQLWKGGQRDRRGAGTWPGCLCLVEWPRSLLR